MAQRIVINPTLQPISLQVETPVQATVEQGYSKAPNTNSWLQAAETMAKLAPNAELVENINIAEQQKKDYLAAQQETAANNLEENKQLLAKLSKKGAVQQGQNPWTNIYRSEMAAHRLVTDEISSKASDLLQSVSQSTNSTEDASKALKQLHTKYSSIIGENPYAQKAFEGAFNGLRNEFLQQSEAIRKKNIYKDAVTEFEVQSTKMFTLTANQDLTNPENRKAFNDSVKTSLDNARLHGISNANDIFLTSAYNNIINIAQDNPDRAREMLALTSSVKPNGRDSMGDTAKGTEIKRLLNYKIDVEEQRAIKVKELQFKAQQNAVLDNIEATSAELINKNPQISSDELERFLNEKFDTKGSNLTNYDALKKIRGIVNSQAKEGSEELKQQSADVQNQFYGYMNTGYYQQALDLLNDASESGQISNKDVYLLKQKAVAQTDLVRKLGSNSLVKDKFGIFSSFDLTDPKIQTNLNTLSTNIQERCSTLGITTQELFANKAEFASVLDETKKQVTPIVVAPEAQEVPTLGERISKKFTDAVNGVKGSYDGIVNATIAKVARDASGLGSAITGVEAKIADAFGLTSWSEYLNAESEELKQLHSNLGKIADESTQGSWKYDMISGIGAFGIELAAMGGSNGSLLVAGAKQGAVGFVNGESIIAEHYMPTKEGDVPSIKARCFAAAEQGVLGSIADLAIRGVAAPAKRVTAWIKSLGKKTDNIANPTESTVAILESAKETFGKVPKFSDSCFDTSLSVNDRTKLAVDEYQKFLKKGAPDAEMPSQIHDLLHHEMLSRSIVKKPDLMNDIRFKEDYMLSSERASKSLNELERFNKQADIPQIIAENELAKVDSINRFSRTIPTSTMTDEAFEKSLAKAGLNIKATSMSPEQLQFAKNLVGEAQSSAKDLLDAASNPTITPQQWSSLVERYSKAMGAMETGAHDWGVLGNIYEVFKKTYKY